MHIVRIIFIPILVAFLFFLSSGGVVITATAQTVTDREQIKTLVAQRSLYDSLRAAVAEGTLFDFRADQDQLAAPTETAEQANNQAIQQVVERYFTVDFYNRASATLVDSFYDWLEGKTQRPQFSIPVTENQAEFRNFITTAFIQRYHSLPPCPAGVVIDASFNPLETNCQAASFSDADVATFINQQVDQPEFQQLYDSATINSDALASDIDDVDAQNLQSTYALLDQLSWLLPLMLVVTAGLIILIIYNRNRSFKTVGLTILPPASALLGVSLIGKATVDSFIRSLVDQTGQPNDPVDNLIKDLLSSLYATVNNRIILMSGLLVIVAASLLILNFVLNRRQSAPTSLSAAKTS